MTAVIGIDLSLTATGVAIVGDASPYTTTFPSFGHRGDSLTQRAERLRSIVVRVRQRLVSSTALVVLEGPSVMSKGGSNWDRAGLWWWVAAELTGLSYPVAVAPPTVVKKWAAGKGNADKAAVAAGVTRLWPDVEPGNDNEFDALAMATMGAQRLGLQVPSRAHHAACLEKVEWPEPMPLSAEDLAAIDEDVRAERAADAADRGGEA